MTRHRFVCHPEVGQRYSRQADSEFLKRCSARNRLSQSLGQFVEFVVHDFHFVLLSFVAATDLWKWVLRPRCLLFALRQFESFALRYLGPASRKNPFPGRREMLGIDLAGDFSVPALSAEQRGFSTNIRLL